MQAETCRGERDAARAEQAEAERGLAEEKAITKDLQRTVGNLQRVMALSHSCRDSQETALASQIDVLTREMEELAQAGPPSRPSSISLKSPFLSSLSLPSPGGSTP